MDTNPDFLPYDPGQTENSVLNLASNKPCDLVMNLGHGGVKSQSLCNQVIV